MKMVKSLILGSAAGLVAVGGAQAADLPVKAKAVEYVKICSLYGAGFYYIPGTDTCIKLGGYLRVEIALGTNTDYDGRRTPALPAPTTATPTTTPLVPVKTSTSIRAPRPNTAWSAPTSMRCSRGRRLLQRQRRLLPARRFTRPSAAAARLLQRRLRRTPTPARSLAVRWACTTPSSSSPASRWVRRYRSSRHLGSTIPATTSTVCPAAAARSLV